MEIRCFDCHGFTRSFRRRPLRRDAAPLSRCLFTLHRVGTHRSIGFRADNYRCKHSYTSYRLRGSWKCLNSRVPQRHHVCPHGTNMLQLPAMRIDLDVEEACEKCGRSTFHRTEQARVGRSCLSSKSIRTPLLVS